MDHVDVEVLGQKVFFEIGQDVDSNCYVAPRVELFDHLLVGARVEGVPFGAAQTVNLSSGVRFFGIEPTVFVEKNYFNKTDVVGSSINVNYKGHALNFSSGYINWDNAGYNENIERYFSVGAGLGSRVYFTNSIFLNTITNGTTYNNSCLFYLDKERESSIALETSVSDGYYSKSYNSLVRCAAKF